jgi:hypothetical protein
MARRPCLDGSSRSAGSSRTSPSSTSRGAATGPSRAPTFAYDCHADAYEGALELAREIATTDEYVVSRRLRKKVEMLFAHLKRILRLDRLRLRGPCGARDEFHLAAAAQNLRKLAKLKALPTVRVA